jgi:hypothetical protein
LRLALSMALRVTFAASGDFQSSVSKVHSTGERVVQQTGDLCRTPPP